MEEMPDRTEKQETRRNVLRKVGKFMIPTLVTFQITTLKAAASGPVVRSLGRPHGKPGWK